MKPLEIAQKICKERIVHPYHFDSGDQYRLESDIARAITEARAEKDDVISKVALLLQSIDKDGKQRRALYAVMPDRLREDK